MLNRIRLNQFLQRAIARFKKHHDDIHKLPEKAVFQMNDTHPTVAVAELMRILLDEEDLSWEDAWDITTHCVAYTNHTIMAEALEKWPIEIFQRLLPRVYQIVEEINRRFVLHVESEELPDHCLSLHFLTQEKPESPQDPKDPPQGPVGLFSHGTL